MSRNTKFVTELGAILGNNKTQKSERHEFQDGEQATGCACVRMEEGQTGREGREHLTYHTIEGSAA